MSLEAIVSVLTGRPRCWDLTRNTTAGDTLDFTFLCSERVAKPSPKSVFSPLLSTPSAVRNLHVRSACETYTDFVHHHLGYPENFLDTLGSLPSEQAGAIQTMFLYVDAFGTYGEGGIENGIAKWFITMLEELCSYPGLRRLDLIWYDREREGLCERLRQEVLEGVDGVHKRGIELTVRYWGDDLL
jgi:hypothetical protein